MKHCSCCDHAKPSDEFYKNKSRRDGLSGWCKACTQIASKAWKEINGERMRETERARAKTEEGAEVNKRKWERKKLTEGFKISNAIRSARYSARKAGRTPAWLTEEDMDAIRARYSLAGFFTWLSGGFVRYDVDHIVPIAGKSVSGLHVPWNLRVLRSDLNRSKGNKFY